MIVKEVTVENWGRYSGRKTLVFKDGFNILAGPNEVGKSTLLNALTTAFFVKYNTRDSEMQLMRPLGTQASPKVSICFSEGGKTYRLEKQYLDRPSCNLIDDGGRMIAQGSKAEDELQKIIRGLKDANGRDKNRGICQALWFLQDDDSASKDEKVWADGIRSGLSRASGNLPASPEEKRIRARIASEYKEYFNPSGSDKGRGPVLSAMANLETLEQKINELQVKKEKMEALLQELNEKTIVLDRGKANLDELKKRLGAIKTIVDEGEELSKQVQELEISYHNERSSLERLADINRRIEARLSQIEELEEEKKSRGSAAEDQAKAAERHRIRGEMLKEEVDALKIKIAACDSALSKLHALVDYREGQERLDKLSRDKKEHNKLTSEAARRRAELDHMGAPRREEMERVKNMDAELRVLEERVKAQSVLVRFSLEDVNVTSEPDVEISDEGDHVVVQPTTFILENVGTITVKGHEILNEDITKISDLKTDIGVTLAKYQVEDIGRLAELAEVRATQESDLNQIQLKLDLITKVDDDELDALTQAQDALRGQLNIDSELDSLPNFELMEHIKTKESERRGLEEDLTEKTKRMNEETEGHSAALRIQLSTTNELSDIDGRIASLRDENKKDLRDFGGIRDDLRSALATKTDQVNRKEKELSNLKKEYDEKFKGPRSEMDSISADIDIISKQVVDLATDKSSLEGLIKGLADEDILERLSDLEEERDEANHRMIELKKHSEAVKLLSEALSEVDSAQNAILSGPIKNLVDGWLATLTNGEHGSVVIDEGLYPLKVDCGQSDLEVKRLSRGTRDQIDVLTRLAVGVLSAKNERNLIVIDDRLVNSDPARLQAMCQIMDEVSKTCQLILATCDEQRYNAVPNAHLVKLP